MRSNLQEEIKQAKPFASLQEELWLNLSRTAAMAGHALEKGLRPHGLSPTQYNVLRILRGAGPKGLCQYEIGERLVAQVPDVPRIIERMDKAGWVQRVRAIEDRRMVMATLTAKGDGLLAELDGQVGAMVEGIFDGLAEEEMVRLIELLGAVRKTGKRE
jgi:DNA-binding MarR family transcriptional regulator